MFRNKELYKKFKLKEIQNKLADFFIKRSISANTVTAIGILLSLFVAYFILERYLIVAGIFVLLVGIIDLVDGTVAQKLKANKKYGFFFAETANMLSDAIIFLAIVIYYFVMISYLEMLLVLFLLLINFLVRELLLLAQILRIKKIEALFLRPEFIIFLAAGLISQRLTIALVVILFFSVVTLIQIIKQFKQTILSETLEANKKNKKKKGATVKQKGKSVKPKGKKKVPVKK